MALQGCREGRRQVKVRGLCLGGTRGQSFGSSVRGLLWMEDRKAGQYETVSFGGLDDFWGRAVSCPCLGKLILA